MEIDARNVIHDGVKVTYVSDSNYSHHVRLRRLRVHNSPHQGILLTGTHHVEVLGGASYNNGVLDSPEKANRYHGLYMGAGVWDCTVRDFCTWDNGAYGIQEYSGIEPGLNGRNLIDGGYHVGNGRLAMRAGVLVGGRWTRVKNIVSTRNEYGIHIYSSARDCEIDVASCDLHGNISGELYIDPEATGTLIK